MGLHHHHHGHDHDHDHAHEAENFMDASHVRKLTWVFGLTFLYLIVEFVGGLFTNSLALLADALHMLGDSFAIGLSLFAAWVCIMPAAGKATFGYQRAEILAAFLNGILLFVLAGVIVHEGYERFQSVEPVHAQGMMFIAIGGMLVNITAAWLLHKDTHHNLNIRGAYLHVLGDLLGSVGAVIASLLIMFFQWNWADPLISAVIAVLVLFNAVRLIREAVDILLEGCPRHVNIDAIQEEMLSFEGIQAVHHLHVWSLDTQSLVLTAHLVVQKDWFSSETLTLIQHTLKKKFGLSHVTIQMEEALA